MVSYAIDEKKMIPRELVKHPRSRFFRHAFGKLYVRELQRQADKNGLRERNVR